MQYAGFYFTRVYCYIVDCSTYGTCNKYMISFIRISYTMRNISYTNKRKLPETTDVAKVLFVCMFEKLSTRKISSYTRSFEIFKDILALMKKLCWLSEYLLDSPRILRKYFNSTTVIDHKNVCTQRVIICVIYAHLRSKSPLFSSLTLVYQNGLKQYTIKASIIRPSFVEPPK